MKRNIIITADGSKTIHLEDWDENYHSKHGAVQEAYHVFIKNGLSLFNNRNVAILEIGFGTGLNALITLIEAKKHGLTVHYTGVEAFPVISKEWEQLHYCSELDAEAYEPLFRNMHESASECNVAISKDFVLNKQIKKFQEINDEDLYDLIYFDAFGARVQPELWTESIFLKMYLSLRSSGVLVTYAAKGSVRRAMQAVGFTTERLPGPPGKREMLRAVKN